MSLQLTEYWKNLDKKKKIALVSISVFVILTVTILILTLTRTKYSVLYGDLSLQDMGEITTTLNEMGVEWKTGEDQKSILVPEKNKNKIKIELATYGLPKEGYTFMDAFNDSGWTMTDYDKKQRIKHALQSELATTISEIEGIKSAQVYIDEKETTNFVLSKDSTNKTTASVFVEKSNNTKLSVEKINAIKHLVAGSVNMEIENVRIVDNEGNLLEETESEFSIDQFAMKSNLENSINSSIKTFLENVVGAGNVDVLSSVKINMDIENTRIVEFAPPIEGNEEGLIRSLEEIEEHMVNGTTGGVPGTETNVEDYTMLEDGNSRYDKVSRIINNELNEINREIRKTPGQVESVTVAVLINKDSLIDGEMTAEMKKEFTDLIYAATGLDTKQVQVQAATFNQADKNNNNGLLPEVENQNINLILISAGIIILLITIIIIMILKSKSRKREEEELERLLEEKASIQLDIEDIDFDAEESKMKAQIDKFIEKKPESVAQLLRNWLNE